MVIRTGACDGGRGIRAEYTFLFDRATRSGGAEVEEGWRAEVLFNHDQVIE